MPMNTAPTIERWHQIARSRSADGLAELIAEDAVFESPVVHKPQVGRDITVKYLTAALQVLGNDSFRYLNEWQAPNSAVLEFEAVCEGITINGVDMIEWNAAGQITRFKVMVRPLKAVNKLHELMGRMLQAGPG
jgi:hypothetical protein